MGYRVAFVVLVACRGGSTPPPDIDASPDAPGIDTTVTLTRNDIPDVNQPVAFQNADGTVLALVMTDPSGVATAKLAEHATVSVLQPFQVSTFIDVPPGDHLTLVTYDDVAPTQQVTVAFPTDPNPTVTNHVVKVACGDLPGPMVAIPVACGASNDVLVRSLADQTPVGMIVAKDVPIVGGAMTVSGTYMPFTDETIMVTNASGVTSTDVFAAIVGAHGPITFDQSTLDLTAGSASETRPSIVQSGVNQEVIVIANTGAMVQFISSIAPSATTFTLDLGAALLPSISAPPVLDRASHRVTWQPTGGALTPDVTVARISITRGSTSWEWLVVGPYVAGELALPTLPVVGLDFNPKPGDDAGVSVLEQLHVPGGYDAARANALSVAVDFNVGGYFPIRIDPTAPGQATAAVFER